MVPSDDAVVVRAGTLRLPEQLRKKLVMSEKPPGHSALSILASDAEPGETREDTIRRMCEDARGIPHSQVMVGSWGTLCEHFAPELDTSDGQSQYHYNVPFRLPVSDSELEQFMSCFGLPEPKPTGER